MTLSNKMIHYFFFFLAYFDNKCPSNFNQSLKNTVTKMTGKTFGKHNYERGTYHFKIHDRNYKLH